MRISDATIQDMLIAAGKIKPEDVDALVAEGKKLKKFLQEIVLKKQLVSEKELTQLYAKEINIPFIELTELKIPKETINLIPERIAKKYRVVLFESASGTKKLAMDDPEDLQAIDFLQKQLGKDTEIYLATTSDILNMLGEYKGSISSELSKVVATGEDDEEEEEQEVSEEDLAEDSPIAQTVNLLIEYAIKAGASDIHIEPREGYLQVRYRVDGVLREANKLPRKVQAALVSRIKILSNLKIDEHRAPQDGRFKISLSNMLYALRVSTLPVMDGEKVVLRLLNESSQALTLEELGYWGEALKTIKNAIAQPHGIVMVTGPTGSGKSTSLYSILSMLNTPGVNISTVEDPVEYRIPGVNQTQVNDKAGMTFANGLRALLRQDPNIIMVGEIRDKETADLAIQAALTGHLVFTTMHTNNAATAIPRLLDMGAEPFLIASTVRAVVGQRLVRKLNPEMREGFTPDEAQMQEIRETFKVKDAIEQAAAAQKEKTSHQKKDNTPPLKTSKIIKPLSSGTEKNIIEQIASDPEIIDRSEEEATKAETEKIVKIEAKETDEEKPRVKEQSITIPDSQSKLTLWRVKEGEGVKSTDGYKGRIGIYEVLNVSPEIQHLIITSATSDQIQDQAVKEGMVTMQQDGFVKTLQGLTTLEEIMRVTRE